MYWVYILHSLPNGRYYTGSTEALSTRLTRHNAGLNISTRSRCPREVVHTEQFGTRKEAISREKQIKARGAKRYLES